MKLRIFLTISALVLSILACAFLQGDTSQEPKNPIGTPDGSAAISHGDPAQGQLLFNGQADGKYPCSVCHSLQPGERKVGPSLAGIATAAAARIEGYSAEQYFYELVKSPNAYIVTGFQPDIMPKEFGEEMTEDQAADLIAFLMTLK